MTYTKDDRKLFEFLFLHSVLLTDYYDLETGDRVSKEQADEIWEWFITRPDEERGESFEDWLWRIDDVYGCYDY